MCRAHELCELVRCRAAAPVRRHPPLVCGHVRSCSRAGPVTGEATRISLEVRTELFGSGVERAHSRHEVDERVEVGPEGSHGNAPSNVLRPTSSPSQ